MAASIGIVGCGAIGQAILREADAGKLNVPVSGVTSRTESTALEFLSTLSDPPPYLGPAELINRSTLIVETAGGHVVPQLAKDVFAAGKDLMVISIGALLEHPEIIEESRSIRPKQTAGWKNPYWPSMPPSGGWRCGTTASRTNCKASAGCSGTTNKTLHTVLLSTELNPRHFRI